MKALRDTRRQWIRQTTTGAIPGAPYVLIE